MFSVPLFRLNNVFGFEEPVVFLYEEATSQVEAQPKQGHKAQQAAQGSTDVDPKEIQSPDAHKKGSKGRDGITGNGWAYVFHVRAETQKEIYEGIRQRMEVI